jgi:2-phosphosulfolactate phosphatase
VKCDSSHIAEAMYDKARKDLFGFMKKNDASHYHRLMGFGLEKDIRYCLEIDNANVLPVYKDGKLLVK